MIYYGDQQSSAMDFMYFMGTFCHLDGEMTDCLLGNQITGYFQEVFTILNNFFFFLLASF